MVALPRCLLRPKLYVFLIILVVTGTFVWYNTLEVSVSFDLLTFSLAFKWSLVRPCQFYYFQEIWSCEKLCINI